MPDKPGDPRISTSTTEKCLPCLPKRKQHAKPFSLQFETPTKHTRLRSIQYPISLDDREHGRQNHVQKLAALGADGVEDTHHRRRHHAVVLAQARVALSKAEVRAGVRSVSGRPGLPNLLSQFREDPRALTR